MFSLYCIMHILGNCLHHCGVDMWFCCYQLKVASGQFPLSYDHATMWCVLSSTLFCSSSFLSKKSCTLFFLHRFYRISPVCGCNEPSSPPLYLLILPIVAVACGFGDQEWSDLFDGWIYFWIIWMVTIIRFLILLLISWFCLCSYKIAGC